MRLGERIRIPFGPVHANGRAIEFHGVTYSGPGLGPADSGMIRRSDTKEAPKVETGDPQPYEEQVGTERQEMRPGEEWFVLVTARPDVRQTVRLTEVTFHWSPAGSLENTNSQPSKPPEESY